MSQLGSHTISSFSTTNRLVLFKLKKTTNGVNECEVYDKWLLLTDISLYQVWKKRQKLLWKANRKPHPSFRIVLFSVTFSDLLIFFKSHCTFLRDYAELETEASSPAGQCILAGCRVTLPRRVLITMSIITMRSRPFLAKSASDCLRFAKPRPQFSNLVAPSTDGSAKCLLLYKVHLVLQQTA